MNDIPNEDARWLALLIDTEGSIIIRREKARKDRHSDRFCAWVSVGNSSKRLIEIAQSMVGLGAVLRRPPNKSQGGRVPMYYWQLTSQQAASFLMEIYPYLIIKHRQAKIAIYAQSLNKNRGSRKGEYGKGTRPLTKDQIDLRMSLWRRCKSLNNHGNPDLSDIPEPDEIRDTCPIRLPGNYELYKIMQDELGTNNMLSGGEIYRSFEISHRQSYRWAKRWKREKGLL